MEKQPKKRGKRWILFTVIGLVVILAAVGVFYVMPRLQASSGNPQVNYQTQPVQVGNITSTVGATGNVYTRQSAALSWATSGIVSKVNVTKGQVVSAGTVLAELDPISLPQTVKDAAIDLTTAQKDLDDLLNSNTARSNAEQALVVAEQNLQSAQKNLQSKQFQRASQQTIDIAQANLIQAQAALDKASDNYNRNKQRSSSDVQYAAALSQLAAAQQNFNKAQYNLLYVQSLPDSLTVQKAMADLDVAQATYQDARRTWERVKDGPNPDDVAAAESKVAAAQAVLDQVKIVAPIAGTVTEVDARPGDLVAAQAAAFQIDDLSHLYTDISVSEVDINNIKVDQPVDITFDALPEDDYKGRVTDIDLVGVVSSGAVNYTVTTEIIDKDPQILLGMTAAASIAITQKTNVLLVPSSAIRNVNSRDLVYVEQNGALRTVFITVGDSSDTMTEVTSGNLREGEAIVLNPPSTTSTNATFGNRGGGIFGGLFGGIFGARPANGGFQPSGGGSQPQRNGGGGSNNSNGRNGGPARNP